MHGRRRHGDLRKKCKGRTDLGTALIVTVVTSSLAKHLGASRELRHAVGSGTGQSCGIAGETCAVSSRVFLFAENASLKMELVHSITGAFQPPFFRRNCTSSVRTGFVPVLALRPSSAWVLRPCQRFAHFLATGAFSVMRTAWLSLLHHAEQVSTQRQKRELLPKRRNATDGPPHRASTNRPSPCVSSLAFVFQRVGYCHISLPPLSDLVSLSDWPALAHALCQDARPRKDLFVLRGHCTSSLPLGARSSRLPTMSLWARFFAVLGCVTAQLR